MQEKRAAAAKAQQAPPSHGGSISTPSGPVSPGIDSHPSVSGGVDRASSDAVAVAAAALARTKSQGMPAACLEREACINMSFE